MAKVRSADAHDASCFGPLWPNYAALLLMMLGSRSLGKLAFLLPAHVMQTAELLFEETLPDTTGGLGLGLGDYPLRMENQSGKADGT